MNAKVNFVEKIKEYKGTILAVLIPVLFFMMFNFSFIQGYSMEDTLNNKDIVLITRVYTYPAYGDIIVITPSNLDVDCIIKRVIALPGDTVAIKDNIIYVNGKAIDEPYIKEPMITANINEFQLAEDEYFVCGDNRNNSLDSRSEILGPIKKNDIYGIVLFIT